MMNQYPRPYLAIVTDMYHTLRKLQHILSARDAPSHVKSLDRHITRILQLRAELMLSLCDVEKAEAIYDIVYCYTLSPSQHAFIYSVKHFSREVRGLGQARTTIPRNA